MAISTDKNGGVFADINITPLTDIFLVLLIIFMVTTAITIESAAHVDLPKVQSQASSQKPSGVVVMYTSDHRIFVNGTEVGQGNLREALKTALAKAPEKLVVFRGDPTVILADMVTILDIAKSAGAEQIALAIGQLPESSAPSIPTESPEPLGEGH